MRSGYKLEEVNINDMAPDIDVVFVKLQDSLNASCNGKPALIGLISLAAAIRWYVDGIQEPVNKQWIGLLIDEVINGDAFGLKFTQDLPNSMKN